MESASIPIDQPAARGLEHNSLIRGYLHTQVSNTIHKLWVFRNMLSFCLHHALGGHGEKRDPRLYALIIWRGLRHDLSKYRWSEAQYFSRTICRLKRAEYGSDEYLQMLDDLRPCLVLHYSRNRHHPEYHANGIADMTRCDLIEMIADWGAATRRSANGNLTNSIQYSSARFGYGQMMVVALTRDAQMMGLI